MAKFADHMEKIESGVVEGYKKIENGVVTGYKKIESGVVNGYHKVEDTFVNAFLAREPARRFYSHRLCLCHPLRCGQLHDRCKSQQPDHHH